MKSPKGIMRMWRFALVFVVLLLVAPFLSVVLTEARLTETIIKILVAALLNFLFYWGMRTEILHERTHELDETHSANRQNALIIGHSIITLAGFSI